ncbi:HD domain-containing protein, partial [Patescibacteria group bacterium]|nr:HD domain-containing protein [Patescibacteria group bacterium]
YRHLGIAVPDTKIVKIDTAYGHSSQVLPQDAEIKMDDLKNGFIADALLANWDIVGNTGNVIFSGRRLIRIDNGGSLLFRARGERKTTFNGIVTELEGMKSSYTGLTQEDIQNQLAVLKERLTDATIDRLVESVRLSFQDRENLKDTLRQRRDYILSYYSAGHEASETKEITDEGKLVESSLRTEIFDDATISAAVPEWRKLTGEEGYQHNGVLLGEHIKNAVSALKYLPEYWSLSDREKGLALVSALFHDIGKPTGRRDEKVPRDFEHEIPSARKAAEYTRKWGYSEADTQTVVQVIINDGIVSDIARDKVRDERKKLTPQQLKNVLDGNPSVLKILRAVNRADVIATVGAEGFNAIADAYNRYFDETLNE